MSQIALSYDNRIAALESIGYTRREAEFLCLAALHGGYFLRRQYCQFLDRAVGGTAAALIGKLSANGHATAKAGCRNTMVYHLGSRPFYSALGQEDNRNRRERPPVAIRNKLMALDYVLDHPERRFLATEDEKVDYFSGVLRVAISELPTKEFRSPSATLSTPHYFVDKYPLAPAGQRSPVVFTFIDEGIATASRFESHLKRYARLFAALSSFELVYVATSEGPFRVAQRCFEAFFGTSNGNGKTIDPDRLIAHFQDRLDYGQRRFEGFDRDRLLAFRDARREHAGLAYDRLFELWKAGGEAAIRESLPAKDAPVSASRAVFSTCILRHNYDVFGANWRPHERR